MCISLVGFDRLLLTGSETVRDDFDLYVYLRIYKTLLIFGINVNEIILIRYIHMFFRIHHHFQYAVLQY
jgi:hypothetical protein